MDLNEKRRKSVEVQKDKFPGEKNDDYIYGRNAVIEAIRSGRPIDKVLVTRGEHTGSIKTIISLCRECGIPVKEIDKRRMESLVGASHQGVAAVTAQREYVTLDYLFEVSNQKGEPPCFCVCDKIEDPHNLGAIIRTADAAGAHGVIIPKRHSAGLTSTVFKASAGAAEYVPVARVTNIAETLRELKKRGVWVYGLDMDGEPWCTVDLRGASAFVVGSEGQGIGRLVREECDFILSLPMLGKVSSLNASVAGGIVLYEVVRQRKGLANRG